MVLDVGTGTGYPALEVLRKMDEAGRIISIDPSSAMLDVARDKAGAVSGKRVYFRSESAEPRLSFASEVFDVVVSNLAVQEMDDPVAAIGEFARVTKPGGRVLVTLPLAGTYREVQDLLREVLGRADREDSTAALERLDAHEAEFPTPAQATAWMEHAGLVDVEVERQHYQLVFRSSREFFFAPVIEHGPLSTWKAVAGGGAEMQAVFRLLKQTIDLYYAGQPFAVTVEAGLLYGRVPLDEERALSAPEHEASLRETGGHEASPDETTPAPAASPGRSVAEAMASWPDDGGGDNDVTGEHEVGTGEIELVEVRSGDDVDEDDPDPDSADPPEDTVDAVDPGAEFDIGEPFAEDGAPVPAKPRRK
jgi:ubiquinone/menaquinone biosynthesis C-methylase UbiE